MASSPARGIYPAGVDAEVHSHERLDREVAPGPQDISVSDEQQPTGSRPVSFVTRYSAPCGHAISRPPRPPPPLCQGAPSGNHDRPDPRALRSESPQPSWGPVLHLLAPAFPPSPSCAAWASGPALGASALLRPNATHSSKDLLTLSPGPVEKQPLWFHRLTSAPGPENRMPRYLGTSQKQGLGDTCFH